MNHQQSFSEIYLDACSTTPPRKEVISAVSITQEKYWGNPSSLHSQGIKAAEQLELNRIKIARIINSQPEDIIFTSGATESINLAIKGCALNSSPGRIVISSVEHPAVIAAAEQLVLKGWEINYWPVDSVGRIKLEFLEWIKVFIAIISENKKDFLDNILYKFLA